MHTFDFAEEHPRCLIGSCAGFGPKIAPSFSSEFGVRSCVRVHTTSSYLTLERRKVARFVETKQKRARFHQDRTSRDETRLS